MISGNSYLGGCLAVALCCQTAMADTRILAWVPAEQAQTATVARALLYIRLAEAKRTTEASLCQGRWVLSGDFSDMQSPRRDRAPGSMGGFPAWHFVIRWQPSGNGACGPEVSPDDYRRLLTRHLPEWMIIQQPSQLASATPLIH